MKRVVGSLITALWASAAWAEQATEPPASAPAARESPHHHRLSLLPPDAPDWLRRNVDGHGRPLPAHTEVQRRSCGQGWCYVLILWCCDQLNPMYDDQGRRLCHPSGGLTGQGDGLCGAGSRSRR